MVLSFFSGTIGTVILALLGALIFIAVLASFWLFKSYKSSFDINVTIIKERRDGYTFKSDVARQKSKEDGSNKLQLWSEQGPFSDKVEIDWPGEKYIETKDGKEHIFLLKKSGDTLVPTVIEEVEKEESFRFNILEGDHRQALITEIRNGEEKFGEKGFWDVAQTFGNIIFLVIGIFGIILLLQQVGDTISSTGESLAAVSGNLEENYAFCQEILQNQTMNQQGELLPGQTPSVEGGQG